MDTTKTKIILSLLISTCLILNNTSVFALDINAVTKIVINELQTNGPGTGTTEQEFIELKNIGDTAVDISNWKLEYIPSTGTLSSAKYFASMPVNTVIYPSGFLLIAPLDYLPDYSPKIAYTSSFTGVAATGGTVSLVNSIDVVVDRLGWGTKDTTLCETELAVAPSGGQSIQRLIQTDQTIDTDNNKTDFEGLIIPSPQTENVNSAPTDLPIDNNPPTDPPADTGTIDPPIDGSGGTNNIPPTDTSADDIATDTNGTNTDPIADQNTTQPNVNQNSTTETVILSVLLNELFIDPGDPLTDASDEFVEIYNPNDETVDLFGYTIYTGSNFTYKHTFTDHTNIFGHSYFSITSGDSSLSLANGGGAAKIVGSNGQIFDQTTYNSAKTNISWAKDNNSQWQWTTTPTKDVFNLFTQLPPVISAAKSSAAVQKAVKSSSTKTASTSTPKTTKAASITKVKAVSDTADSQALIAAPTPLPIWLLAILGVLAVIYSGYEYRFDLANKFYRLQQYRSGRRANR